ncbi:hypothetical protein EB796_011186 [Bugula neritina]|uniref:Uncharacterized protein n=1 Tax=Bugula neritina TaxID=10212 RepID=A0A7J7JYU7_BUGNE|nr:hypothetical protein EB796_011186 [Bugula neritina]
MSTHLRCPQPVSASPSSCWMQTVRRRRTGTARLSSTAPTPSSSSSLPCVVSHFSCGNLRLSKQQAVRLKYQHAKFMKISPDRGVTVVHHRGLCTESCGDGLLGVVPLLSFYF